MPNSDDIEHLFQRAKSSHDKEARNQVIVALREQLAVSVPRGIAKRFGANQRMNPEDYIQKIITKLLDDWEGDPTKRRHWKSSKFDKFHEWVNYWHTACVNSASDSERGEEVRQKHANEQRELHPQPQDRREEANEKVRKVQDCLDQLTSNGAISTRDRNVWVAWHLREAPPKRNELVREFALANDDEVSRVIKRINHILKPHFPDWGPGGITWASD